MKFENLRAVLVPSSGTLTVSRAALGSSVDALLDDPYQGQPIVISDAAPGPGDGVDNTVVIIGRSTFLGVADLPVTARFSLDGEGNVQALLRYQLRDSMPGPAAWTFSRSFPKLPAVWNYATGYPTRDAPVDVSAQQKPYVDSLDLFDTYCAVSTHARKDPDSGVPLEPGVNVLGKMRPQGMAGVLEYAINGAEPLVLYGPVRIPKLTDKTRGLAPRELVWDRPEAPGIHLKAALSLDFKIGKLAFEDAALRIYTPPSTDWQDANASFQPGYGYTGRLSVASAGITLDLAANLEWGLPRAFLSASCNGVTLGKLSQLVDIAGTDNLVSALPADLRDAVNALEKLELMELGLALSTGGTTPTVDSIVLTVGMPKLRWKIWDDTLVVENLACRFRILDPFGGKNTATAVSVMGTVKIEGVPISVIGESILGEFTLYARMDNQTLPLASLMKSHVPGVPAPSDLTVTHLGLSISPGRSYSMTTQLAGKPKPWTLPVGRNGITIGDVSFDFRIPKTGPVSGSFAGTASLGKNLRLAMNYEIPANFALRGDFKDIQLRGLINEICDLVGEMPADFDLTFSSASALVQKRGEDYVLQLAAALDKVGLFAFEASRSAGKWGFAAGMDLGAARLSSLPGLSALESIEDVVKLRKLMLIVSSIDNPKFQFPDLAQFKTPALSTGKLSLPTGATGVSKGFMAFAEWQLDPNDKQHNLVMKLLGLGGTQRVTVAVGANPAKDSQLFLSQQSKINGLPFNYKLGVMLSNGKPSFFLNGSLTAKIQKQQQTFDVTTAFVSGGAFMSATMKGATAVDCGPFKLSNVALQVGVNWGGIPSLGVAATIDTKSFSSSVAVFFDSTNPANSLVAGSISGLTFKDVAGVFLGGMKSPVDAVLESVAIKGTREFTLPGDLTDELDGLECDKISSAFDKAAKVAIPSSSQQLAVVPRAKGSSWHLTDLTKMRHYELDKQGNDIRVCVSPQFYFAPQETSIGTIKFRQAFYLNAAISFCGFDAEATIDVVPGRGISIDAQMDKISLLDDKLFSIAALQGGGGPRISAATYSQPDQQDVQFQPPHFYINGSLTLLGVKRGLYANVTTQGIDFELVGNLMPGVKFDLDARFGKSGLGVSGKVKVGVGTVDLGALGKAKINTDIEVDVDLDITGKAHDVSAAPDTRWAPGSTVLANEVARLVFEADGNLVLYRIDGANWGRIWASNSGGKGGNTLLFQNDGNLVIYAPQGPIWATGSNTPNLGIMKLQADSNFVLYESTGRAKWASNTGRGGDGSGAELELEADFQFAGQRVDLGRFKVEVTGDTFSRLPKIIEKKCADALNEVFKDSTKWANAVADGLMDGVGDTAKVFRDVYKKSEKEAKALANDVSKGVNKAGKTIENTANSAYKSTKKTVKKLKFW
ncbi:hypothetical protein [Archangium violaceum]|uniref:hypothetical protein n=1 Tax=Archangium violaceum TaxID=83451 RepID=UPI0036D852CD